MTIQTVELFAFNGLFKRRAVVCGRLAIYRQHPFPSGGDWAIGDVVSGWKIYDVSEDVPHSVIFTQLERMIPLFEDVPDLEFLKRRNHDSRAYPPAAYRAWFKSHKKEFMDIKAILT